MTTPRLPGPRAADQILCRLLATCCTVGQLEHLAGASATDDPLAGLPWPRVVRILLLRIRARILAGELTSSDRPLRLRGKEVGG